jgi:hypothetical protein
MALPLLIYEKAYDTREDPIFYTQQHSEFGRKVARNLFLVTYQCVPPRGTAPYIFLLFGLIKKTWSP